MEIDFEINNKLREEFEELIYIKLEVKINLNLYNKLRKGFFNELDNEIDSDLYFGLV